MVIRRLSLYALPLQVGMNLTRYVASQSLQPALENLVVKLETDDGTIGWGEVCSAPPYYLPELPGGAREGIQYVASLLFDRDPRQVLALSTEINTALRGHGNAKTALEMALWDLAAKTHGLALVDLWGGRVAEAMPVLTVLRIGDWDGTLASLESYRALGYSRFQVKVGAGDNHADITTIRRMQELAQPHERIWYDPNRGWTVDDALRVILAVRDTIPMIENPCESYEECRTVARRTGVPFMLDEVIDGPRRFLQAAQDEVLDVVSLKTSAVGGIEATRTLMTLGRTLGIPMRIEDYYGTGILQACVTHLAHTLPEPMVFGLYDFVSDELPLVKNPLRVEQGRMRLPDDYGPGLGVEVDETLLGEPVAVLEG